ncbi:hypothetical protein [Haladaptatus sp. DFWS20]|uniref:hypothetical protein n=1 Tax=Haladaptatus sp. DFWS20 TaxID=3403467 RepID=UPI003EB9D112
MRFARRERGDGVASKANSAELRSADCRAAMPRDNGEAVSRERSEHRVQLRADGEEWGVRDFSEISIVSGEAANWRCGAVPRERNERMLVRKSSDSG